MNDQPYKTSMPFTVDPQSSPWANVNLTVSLSQEFYPMQQFTQALFSLNISHQNPCRKQVSTFVWTPILYQVAKQSQGKSIKQLSPKQVQISCWTPNSSACETKISLYETSQFHTLLADRSHLNLYSPI